MRDEGRVSGVKREGEGENLRVREGVSGVKGRVGMERG